MHLRSTELINVAHLQNIIKRFDYLREYPQLVIVFVGMLLRLPLLFTSLSFSTDAWRQADTASIAYHFYLNCFKILYPQIFWGGNGPGYVETEFQLYPYIVSILYYFFGEHYWLGKFVSLLFSVFAWLLFFPLAQRVLGDKRKAIWALLFLVFSPLYLRYSVAFMPEATVMFFYVAALFFFVNWTSSSRKNDLVFASICTALAILVKPTSIHLILVFALAALSKWGLQVLRRWEVWLSALIALLPGVAWYLHARNIYLTFGNTFGLLSGGDSKFGSLGSWLRPHLYYHIPYLDLKWTLGFGASLLFIVGALIAIKRKGLRLILFGLATIGLYYTIVPRYSHEEWGIQYHVYILPFAALAVGLGVEWILDNNKGFVQIGILWLSAGVFFGATLVLFFGMLFSGNDGLYECAGYVKQLVPATERIIVSTTSPAFDNGIPNNYQEPQIFFYSRHYGWSLPADEHNVEKLVEYRTAGASYFVIYSNDLLVSNPNLANYLNENSVQSGPGVDNGCAIYRFSSPPE
jgi:4-amino-4-deoxy-L-arabinose transferase-like glycosyltransferase